VQLSYECIILAALKLSYPIQQFHGRPGLYICFSI